MSLFRGLGARKDSVRGTAPIEVRKSLSGLFSATGVLPGGPSPLLTGTAGWAYTVAGPAYFVTSRGASDGHQLYGNDGAAVIGTTGVGSTVPVAPGAGLQRIDIAWTRHPTNTENADTSSEPMFGVESGTAAASNPVAPTLPAGAIELGRNTMTSAATNTSSAGNTITQSAPVAALRGAPDTGWVNLPLTNGWTGFTADGEPAAASRLIGNVMRLRGAVNNGTNGTVLCTLSKGSTGYQQFVAPVRGSSAIDQIVVYADGNVIITGYTAGQMVFLDSVAFMVD
jgi:hypothetical protein